jgi:hypothetical protein
MLQWFCPERGLTMNVKKKKSWCSILLTHAKKFVFEGDTIKLVQTFKYLGILLESTPTLDVLVVFRALSKDLKNPQYTTSITFIFFESTQTSHA